MHKAKRHGYDKVGFRTYSLPTPMPICYIFSISLIYDSVWLTAKYIDNKKSHEVHDTVNHAMFSAFVN